MKRVLTALPLVVMLIVILEYLPPVFFAGLVALISFLAIEEYFQIARKSEIMIFRWPGHAAALGLIAALFFFPQDSWLLLAVLVVLALTLLGLGLGRGDALHTVLAGVSATVFALIYVALSLGLLVLVFLRKGGNQWVFFGLLAVWFGDTAAFVAGKTLGRHKLAPAISPNKTWEGSLGGLIGSSLAALLAHRILLPAVPWFSLLLVGWLLGIFGQIGDLAESALKRGAQVKDSSNLLPGHGGMLDRIDGVLFAAPVLFVCTQFFLP